MVGKEDELDKAVRVQLAEWFVDFSNDILYSWEQKGDIYEILNAQPSQIGGPSPANVHLGRDCATFRGVKLPSGILVCGDYMVRLTKKYA